MLSFHSPRLTGKVATTLIFFLGSLIQCSIMVRVFIVIDEYGWGFDFLATAIERYTSLNVQHKRWSEVRPEHLHWCDVFCCLNWSVFHAIPSPIIRGMILRSHKLVVGFRGWRDYPRNKNDLPQARATMCVSKEMFRLLKKDYPEAQIWYVPNAVDCEIFKPNPTAHEGFIVGWAGNPTALHPSDHGYIKRFHLLKKLSFQVKIKAEHGRQYFKKGRSRQPMVDFYNSIDAYVQLSQFEGMPQTVLEAAACQLPIVATAVGDIPEFLPKEWLINSHDENIIVDEANRLLQKLKDDVSLRKRVGAENYRIMIEKGWCMKDRVKEYERFFCSIL